MKPRRQFPPNGDEARFAAATADFEVQEARFVAQERLTAAEALAPSLEVYHLDTDRYLILIEPAFQADWQFPKERCQVAECSVSLPLNNYALFVRSRVSPERLQENVSYLFLPF